MNNNLKIRPSDGSLPRMTLLIGGTASGKSKFAERIVEHSGYRPVYLATAEAFDSQMRERISRHKARRSSEWLDVEEPFDLARVVLERMADEALLLECMTTWLANLLHHGMDAGEWIAEFEASLERAPCRIVVISNETGWGIIPDNAASREFNSALGLLNERLANRADTVAAIVAGQPIVIKGVLPS